MATSFNIFSSPPAIPSSVTPPSSVEYAHPITIQKITAPPVHLLKHRIQKKKTENANDSSTIEEEGEQQHKDTRKTKHEKRVWRHRGCVTRKLGEEHSGVTLAEDMRSYVVRGAPFHFAFSYTEMPRQRPIAARDPPLNPFAAPPPRLPWIGRTSSKNLASLLTPLPSAHPNPSLGPFLITNTAQFPPAWNPLLVQGQPLSRDEITELLKDSFPGNSQVNLGRDGLTHNMLELIHSHWKRRPVCKIKCKGVPTVDMNHVCHHLEEKTGGKVIYRRGGVVHLFRGRNYNHKTRPRFPVMLWKPLVPLYPDLIERAPAGLTIEEADELRKKGHRLEPLCKLGIHGVYLNLVKRVKEAFESSELVRIKCKGMRSSDYKRIGIKLKELVPCVLLSFERECILMWRGQDCSLGNTRGYY